MTAPDSGATDAEIEALEQTISDLEKQVQVLEDDVTDAQRERDLVHNENKVSENDILIYRPCVWFVRNHSDEKWMLYNRNTVKTCRLHLNLWWS